MAPKLIQIGSQVRIVDNTDQTVASFSRDPSGDSSGGNSGNSPTVFNVKDVTYGAKGDGVTDDTAAIMAAINACGQAGGGIVWFPPGNYRVATPTSSIAALVVAYDNVHLRGSGVGATRVFSELASQGVLALVGPAKPTGSYPSSSGNWYQRGGFYRVAVATFGDNTITFSNAADAGNFAAGDLIYIRTGQCVTAAGSHDQPDSEVCEVLSANAGTGVVTLRSALAKSYAQEYFPTVGTTTTTSADANPGDTTITVASGSGFSALDYITIIGTGTNPSQQTQIASVVGNVITLKNAIELPIPSGATVHNGSGITTTGVTASPAVFGVRKVTNKTLNNVSVSGMKLENTFSTASVCQYNQVRNLRVQDVVLRQRGAGFSGNAVTNGWFTDIVHQGVPQGSEQGFFVVCGTGSKGVHVSRCISESQGFGGVVMSEGTVHFWLTDLGFRNTKTSGGTDYPINVQSRSGIGFIDRCTVLNGGSDAAVFVDSRCIRGGLIHGTQIFGGNFTKNHNIQASGWTVDVYGNGTPEGVLGADRGSRYGRKDGGVGTCLYIKEQDNVAGDVTKGWVTLAPAGTGFTSFAVRSTDSAAIVSNTTPANDDTLLVAIGLSPTEVWFVEAFLLVNAANITMDVKFGWSFPTGLTGSWGAQGSNQANLGAFGAVAAATTPIAVKSQTNTDIYGTAAGTIGVALAGVFFGGGTPGNLNLQVAQGTSDPGNLILKKGSFLRAMKLVA